MGTSYKASFPAAAAYWRGARGAGNSGQQLRVSRPLPPPPFATCCDVSYLARLLLSGLLSWCWSAWAASFCCWEKSGVTLKRAPPPRRPLGTRPQISVGLTCCASEQTPGGPLVFVTGSASSS